jgi:CBS domain containing-hemolysin-like protein
MDLLTITWQFGLILLLVFANGFFVASEFAIVKVRTTQLKPLLKSKDWRVPISLNVVKNLDAYLSATQLGITLSSLGLGWLGEPYLAHWIKPLLAHYGFNGATAISFAISFGIITFMHIVLGELAPKSLSIQRPRQIALWCAPFLLVFYYIFFPAIWLLNGSANIMLRLLGIPPAGEGEHAFSNEELQQVLKSAHYTHAHDEIINKIMLKALRLRETTAEQIMLPKDKVFVLWRDKSLEENLIIAQRTGYSRLPYCGASIDDVLGMIHVKELLWQHEVLGNQTILSTLVRPVLTFLPKTKLPSMLDLFRSSRNHLAVVLDLEEKMLGIVSFEDVLEELVGDIRDEFDIEKGPFFERKPDSVLIDAELPLRDLAVETGWPLPTNSNQTVEKWALSHWGRVPFRGEQMLLGEGVRIIAEQVTARRIYRLRVEKVELNPENTGDASEPGQNVT